MCSWCYGISGPLKQIREKYTDILQFNLVLGGLRPGQYAEEVDQQMKNMLRHHWEEVRDRTGENFDFSFFDRKHFIYDTEPSCRAVVTVRELSPGKEYDYFYRLQKAFYSENRDIGSEEVLAECLKNDDGSWLIDEKIFPETFNSQEIKDKTTADFNRAHYYGINGFPSLLLLQGEDIHFVATGYRDFNEIDERLQNILKV